MLNLMKGYKKPQTFVYILYMKLLYVQLFY